MGGEEVNSEAPWFYIGSFARVAAPWSLIAAWCVLHWLKRTRKGDVVSSREDRLGRVVRGLRVCLCGGLHFLFPGLGKRHSYLLPLFPFLSIALAAVLFFWWGRQTREVQARQRWVVRVGAWGAAFLLVVFPALLLFPLVAPSRATEFGFPTELVPLVFRSLLMVGTASIAGFFAFYMLARVPSWREPARAHWLLAFGTFCLLAIGITLGNSVKNELKSFPFISSQVRGVLGAKPLAVIRSKGDEFFDPVLFYIEREATLIPPKVAQVPCGGRNGACAPRVL